MLDLFKDEIHRLLLADPKLPGQRVRELTVPLGLDGGKTIVDDYLREVRPLFAPARRTFQRTVYRSGEICQFDVWEPKAEIPVGHDQTRRGWVAVACLGYSRAGAGALIFTKQTPDLLAGSTRTSHIEEVVCDKMKESGRHLGKADCGSAWTHCESARVAEADGRPGMNAPAASSTH